MANRGVLLTYREIGAVILAQQETEGWGAKVIDRLADDLQARDPDGGWSRSNLHYMRKLATLFPDEADLVQHPAGQLSWGTVMYLVDKFADQPEVLRFYAACAVRDGLGRPRLVTLVASEAHKRRGAAASNYTQTLPAEQAGLVQEALNDTVVLSHLGLTSRVRELDLEAKLVHQVQETMRQLGYDLAFVGRQVPVSVGDDDFFIDLLLFNLAALCYVVVELKVEDYRAEFAGKMNLYLNAIDRLRKLPQHHQTVGVILVPGRNVEVVRASIPGMLPMAVSTYDLGFIDAAVAGPAALRVSPGTRQLTS